MSSVSRSSAEIPAGEQDIVVSIAGGADAIAAAAKRLPDRPGVYRMVGEDGAVLYVGKARSLRKRVASYTRLFGQPGRTMRMIQATTTLEVIVTRTETEALLLEANLIKRLRPRYNVLLRDDKSFPYILISGDHEAPQIMKHRGPHRRKGDYYGPFASAGAVDRTINSMERAFLLRSCSDGVYESRTRPCLLFQIKRCSAPCTGEISLADYAELVRGAKAFLAGKSQTVRKDLAKSMEEAAARLDFEQAATYRDRIAAMSHVQSHQGINPQSVKEADVFACYQEGGQTSVQVFFFRTGQNWGNRAYYPKADKSLGEADVLESFLAQFYDDKPPPRLILLSHRIEQADLLATALSQKADRKVEVSAPSRGERRDLVDHALANARESLGQKLAETSSQAKLMGGLAEAFGLAETPRRVEVYDNSHIMGAQAVGAMIVAGPEGFEKNQYRRFNIKSEALVPGDDFGMMREVLRRRFTRLLKEAPRETAGGAETGDSVPWPDLVLIDGGAGQLSAAQEVMADLGLEDLPMAGIAKGKDRDAGLEKFHMAGRQPFMMQPRDPVLYFVQRLRDEAHRFAIGSHRAKRKAQLTANPLDEISGIGPARKRALLRHFGTAKALSRASIRDLSAVDGISEQIAQTIYDHFNAR